MLIKEYRIPLPMTVEEYRIAQLFMIAKKSREETKVREERERERALLRKAVITEASTKKTLM